MKKFRYLAFVVLFFTNSVILVSCGVKDSSIQESIASIKQNNPDLAGLNAEVDKGVVTLSGELKDEASRSLAVSSVKEVKGVKQVIDKTTITPPPPPAAVEISPDDALTDGVNDAIKDFPTVKASVKDGVITLTGEIKRSNLQKLMVTLNTLKPKKIDNQLTIK